MYLVPGCTRGPSVPGTRIPGTQILPGHGTRIGDLWMWLQLMWFQFEVVRGPVGIIGGRFGAGLPGPKKPCLKKIGTSLLQGARLCTR